MHAELVMLLANEKTFRDRDSGFVEILSYKLWVTSNCLATEEIKPQFSLVKILMLA